MGYVKEGFKVESFGDANSYYDELLSREIKNVRGLKKWIADWFEFDAAMSEDYARKYIATTVDVNDEVAKKVFEDYIVNVVPKSSELEDELNRKFIECEINKKLPESYSSLVVSVKRSIDLYRKENLELFIEEETLARKYINIVSNMSIEHGGKRMTMEEAANFLESRDEKIRMEVYTKMAAERMRNSKEVDPIFLKMIDVRRKIASNCGFDGYEDYFFEENQRDDYTKQDCQDFHESVIKHFKPIYKKIMEVRAESIGKTVPLRHWNTLVNPFGSGEIKLFDTQNQMESKIERFMRSLSKTHGSIIEKLRREGNIDLESRIGKAPGAYMYPLFKSKTCFVFMNSTGTFKDASTLVHELGHAIHNELCFSVKHPWDMEPETEMSELASMSHEQILYENVEVVIDKVEDIKAAKFKSLEDGVWLMLWANMIDEFQHVVYSTGPDSLKNGEDLSSTWLKILDKYWSGIIDFSGMEAEAGKMWHKQLHLFEYPFYYIEYAICQLGAFSFIRNYETDREKSIKDLMAAMRLGSSVDLKELYSTAGIKFDFSDKYVGEIAEFVERKLKQIKEMQ